MTRIRAALSLIIIAMLLPSCQGMRTSATKRISHPEEEKFLLERKKDLEGYVQFADRDDFSIETFLRLTEGYTVAMEALHKKEMEDYEKEQAAAPSMPFQDYTSFASQLGMLKERFKYSKKGDAISYILGYALSEQGKGDEAARVFEDIVKNYPQSSYWLEVNFRLGEYYFETGRTAEAIEAYNRILSHPQSAFYEKALYKLGWIYYKLEDFRKAIDTFEIIADRNEPHGKEGLAGEAMSCIVLAASRFSDISQAIQYLESKGAKGYTPDILMRLSDLLSEQTRYEPALAVLNRVIEAFPDLPSRPFVYEKVSYIYEQMGDGKEAERVREELVDRHNPDTPWYKKNCVGGGCEKVDDLVSKTIISSLKVRYRQGKNENNTDMLNSVIKGCRILLTYYPAYRKSGEVNLLLAESLFYTKAYGDAVKEYEKSALLYPKGQERGEIAYNAVLAYEILFLKTENEKDKTTDSARQVVETYRKDLIESEKLEKAIYKLADMYIQSGSYGLAREAIGPLMKGKNPVPAYYKTVETFLLENNLPAAESLLSEIIGMSGDSKFKEELARIRYKMAEDKVGVRKYKEAAELFDHAFETYPASDIGEASLLKLGSVYIKTGQFSEIKGVAGRIARAYPGSPAAVSLLVEGGYAVEKEDPIEAARLYEDASSTATSPDEIGRLILAAAAQYEEGGEYGKVEALFVRYLKEIRPGIEEEAEVRLKLARSQFLAGKREKGRENFKNILAREGEVAERLLAKARLMLAEDKQRSYMEIKLTQPFEKTFKQKTLLLEDLIKDYSQLAKSAEAELQVEIFFQTGIAFENFRDSILKAEKPKDLSKNELEEYNFLLEEKAYPYEEQAVKAYEKSLKAGRANAFREWVEKDIERLAVLRPALYMRRFKDIKIEQPLIDPEPAVMGDGL